MFDDAGKFRALMAELEAMPAELRETTEGLSMLAEAMDAAPPELKALMEEKLKEMLPRVPDCVDDAGRAFYSYEQLAAAFGQPVEEVKARYDKLIEIRPQLFTPIGSIHRVN